MAIDKGTILQNAQKYTAKGLLDKAIEEWQKLIKESPNDGNVYNTIGDLYLKKNAITDASNAYLKAAQSFDKAGFALKTIAVYKKIIKIDPNRFDVYLKLGDVNAGRGLVGNAVDDYLKVAKHFVATGRLKEGVEVYRKIARLDPTNVSIRLKVAEMCIKEGLNSEAIEEYLGVAEEYTKQERREQAAQLYEQILKIEPAHPKAKAAISQLQGPSIGETPPIYEAVISSAKPADLVTDQTALAQHESVIEPPSSLKEDSLPTPSVEETPSQESKEQSISLVEATDPPASGPGNVPAGPSLHEEGVNPSQRGESLASPEAKPESVIEPETIQGCFAEAEVYLKYGLTQKAIEQLKQVLDQDPYNEQAHRQLKEIYQGDGQVSEAVMECIRLAKIYEMEGNQERYAQITQEALALDPNHRQVKLMAGLPAEGSVEEKVTSKPSVLEASEASATEFNTPVEDLVGTHRQTVEGPSSGEIKSLDDIMNPKFLSPAEIAERLAEGEFYLQQGLKDEAKKIYQLILSAHPDQPEACERLTELSIEEDIDREISEVPEMQVSEESPDREGTGSRVNAGVFEDSDIPKTTVPSSGQALESDFEDLSIDDLVAGNRSTEVVSSQPSVPEKSVEAVERDEGFIDLSDVLKEDLEEKPIPQEIPKTGSIDAELENVFKEFQKGIQEQFGEEDYETHYNLGIAYKEMGLINEAIGEFELSIKGTDRFIDSCSMLSTCFMEKGLNDVAISHLEKALGDPRCNEKNALWLKYELGGLYEREGYPDKALDLFMDIGKADIHFKDVKEKIEALKAFVSSQNSGLRSVNSKRSRDSHVSDPNLVIEQPEKKSGDQQKRKRRISYL